jgi:hypothetical protein
MKRIRYSAEEKQRIIDSLRALAIAQAEFWDVLGEVESAHSVMIEADNELAGTLAGNCNIPATFADLPESDVWFTFKEHTEVQS